MSTSQKSSIWTPANVVTMVRICLVPVFVVALLSPWPEWFGLHDIISYHMKSILAAVVFIFISCTDWIDGYLARSRGEVTDFGKLIDPLADKILVAAALLALVELQVLPSWPVLIILAREFIISGVRMLAASKGVIIAASWYGKAKTVLQIAAIILFLIKEPVEVNTIEAALHSPLYLISWAVMIAALVLTVLSMVDYLSKAWPLIRGVEDDAVAPVEGASKGSLEEQIGAIAMRVIKAAVEKGVTLCTAESLTGGMISTALTSVPGSSTVFYGGVVSYALSVKARVLGVDQQLLESEGAVDGTVAVQMAQGAAQELGADIAISVTGIAGPGGAEEGKPVGTVFMGIARKGEGIFVREQFEGSRMEIREQTTLAALRELERLVREA